MRTILDRPLSSECEDDERTRSDRDLNRERTTEVEWTRGRRNSDARREQDDNRDRGEDERRPGQREQRGGERVRRRIPDGQTREKSRNGREGSRRLLERRRPYRRNKKADQEPDEQRAR